MALQVPVGPFKFIQTASGGPVPLFVIPFDKAGNCQAPRTRNELIKQCQEQQFTDIYIFSHGWNNDFPTAMDRYERFANGFAEMCRRRNLRMPDRHKAVLVGVFWPSSALVFGDERAPDMAASTDATTAGQATTAELNELQELAEQIDASRRERFYELAQQEALNEEEARELAEIVATLPSRPDEEVSAEQESSPDEFMALWDLAELELGRTSSDDDFGIAAPVVAATPAAAGIGDVFRRLDPRPILRLATVWQMKDRAGTVGAHGVGLLLRDLLSKTDSRLHLIGHSYGAKVMLSATCFGADVPRLIHSMLLLQPAVSHLCFSQNVARSGRSGGYVSAPDRVQQPILVTFSAHDSPLRRFFHLAVRRADDLGEAQIAGDEPPSRFAALGGYGPRDCNERTVEINDEGTNYALDANVGIYGIRGTRAITGHGDVSRPETWWALYSLVGSG